MSVRIYFMRVNWSDVWSVCSYIMCSIKQLRLVRYTHVLIQFDNDTCIEYTKQGVNMRHVALLSNVSVLDLPVPETNYLAYSIYECLGAMHWYNCLSLNCVSFVCAVIGVEYKGETPDELYRACRKYKVWWEQQVSRCTEIVQ